MLALMYEPSLWPLYLIGLAGIIIVSVWAVIDYFVRVRPAREHNKPYEAEYRRHGYLPPE